MKLDCERQDNYDIEPEQDQNEIDEHQTKDILIAQSKEDINKAKEHELDQWKERNVYIEEEDTGQPCISLRWVITEKIINDRKCPKTRLDTWAFEEEQSFRTDSPTCSREGVR